MKAMVGFRNIAVHDYQRLDPDIVLSILTRHLDDFRHFCDSVFRWHVARRDGQR